MDVTLYRALNMVVIGSSKTLVNLTVFHIQVSGVLIDC